MRIPPTLWRGQTFSGVVDKVSINGTATPTVPPAIPSPSSSGTTAICGRA